MYRVVYYDGELLNQEYIIHQVIKNKKKLKTLGVWIVKGDNSKIIR